MLTLPFPTYSNSTLSLELWRAKVKFTTVIFRSYYYFRNFTIFPFFSGQKIHRRWNFWRIEIENRISRRNVDLTFNSEWFILVIIFSRRRQKIDSVCPQDIFSCIWLIWLKFWLNLQNIILARVECRRTLLDSKLVMYKYLRNI